MKHFTSTLWKAAQGPVKTLETLIDGFTKMPDVRDSRNPRAISYTLKPAFVRTFATSGYPFLTFYEFNDLAGWCRDTYFAPQHVPGYADDIGTAYTVWTHDAFSAYRRHIFLDKISSNIAVTFEIPSLDAAAWFPLRIRICDAQGLFFQTDQKLVVERIQPDGSQLTSWKKIPQLRDSLPRLHLQTVAPQ